jgi:pyruvate,water dikinase
MPWRPLDAFRDAAVPKLHNLRLAARAGLRIPEWTYWAPAEAIEANAVELWPGWQTSFPVIVRSASPSEDTNRTSNAGQFQSVVADDAAAVGAALQQVVQSLPKPGGRPAGAVFVQPLLRAEVAGVTFFDGFYYEETRAGGSNAGLTAGRERGQVCRGHVQRGDPHHEWLARVQAVFGGTIDIEWARPAQDAREAPVLLQVRPALFPIRRNETLSLANHKEILGDPPSPWMVGVIADVARPVLRFFEAVDPAIKDWDERYAVDLAERGWLNFSVFFRMMDRWGLPRTMVTEGIGGESGGPADSRWYVSRLIGSLPVLTRLTFACIRTVAQIGRGLRALEVELSQAQSLGDVHRVNVHALEFSIRTNFAIVSMLAVLSRMRRQVGIGRAGHVITQTMMAEYAELASRPELADRLRGLEDWLRRYGHRGPLESDPRRPRFVELRDVLQADLARGPSSIPPQCASGPRWASPIARPLFLLDEYRERFRDQLMRWWQKLRTRMLEEARRLVEKDQLGTVDDVFFLRGEDLLADPATWRARVASRRAARRDGERLELPATSSRDAIEAAIASARQRDHGEAPPPDRFVGIGLGQAQVIGTAVRASTLASILNGRTLPDTPVLVVDTLEPSWAVVFPRFSAVVAALGGELSHASILLREAGIPAVVNAQGAYRAIADGDRIRVDSAWGEVSVEARCAAPLAAE